MEQEKVVQTQRELNRCGGGRLFPIGAAVAVLALTACGAQSPTGDSAKAATLANQGNINATVPIAAAAAATVTSLPIEQGLYAEAGQGCARSGHIFFYDGINYGEIRQAEQAQEVPPELRGFEGASSPASAEVYRIRRAASPAPGSAGYDDNFPGFTRIWHTENAEDEDGSLVGVKAIGSGRFTKREGGYGANGVFHGRDDSYQKCAFAQLSPQMQAAIRTKRPQLAGMAAGANAPAGGATGFPPIEKGYYAINTSCAAAVADPYLALIHIDEKRIRADDGIAEILGYEALGGDRYRQRTRSKDESGAWHTSSEVVRVIGRTSFTVEHSYESFGKRVTDTIAHTHCPTAQIPRAIRQDWGDLAGN